MNKLTIIGALALSAMAYAQHGNGGDKGKHPQSNPTNVPSNNPNKHNGPAAVHGNPQHQSNAVTHALGDQGHGKNGGGKNPGNNGGAKNHGNNAVHPPGGNGKSGNGKPGGHGNNGPSMNGDKGHGDKGHGNHGNQHPGNTGKNMHPFEKITHSHPNFGYIYVNKHGIFSHSNYGHWRSNEARKKHKKYHPVYEYQAVQGFNFIVVRNQFLFTEIDYKINLLRVRLDDRRRSGAITVVQYNNSIQTIALLERRRAAVEVYIEL